MNYCSIIMSTFIALLLLPQVLAFCISLPPFSDCCGDIAYAPQWFGCCGNKVYELGKAGCCGTELYEPTGEEICCEESLVSLYQPASDFSCCGSDAYNIVTDTCDVPETGIVTVDCSISVVGCADTSTKEKEPACFQPNATLGTAIVNPWIYTNRVSTICPSSDECGTCYEIQGPIGTKKVQVIGCGHAKMLPTLTTSCYPTFSPTIKFNAVLDPILGCSWYKNDHNHFGLDPSSYTTVCDNSSSCNITFKKVVC